MVEYCCPDEKRPISRAVHLGRLARFFPACRQCAHRDETGTLSARHVERLAETRSRGLMPELFQEEGVQGVYRNEFSPAAAQETAAALGIWLIRQLPHATEPPVVAVGNDGRTLACEVVAAVSRGLRWAGCHLVDLGPVTAPCLAFAVNQLPAAGGILVGRPDRGPQVVGLKFWAPEGRPISSGPSLDAIRKHYHDGTDRPTRAFGPLRRFQADVPYLAGLAKHYHALRPLRLVLDTTCEPFLQYAEKLTEPVACEILPRRTASEQLARRLVDKVHLGVRVYDDGEVCTVFDEQGNPVPAERLTVLLARHALAQQPGGTVVLEEGTSAMAAEAIEAFGGRVLHSPTRRAEMEQLMREHQAVLGGGNSGRFWHVRDAFPLPDALMTLTSLLVILSQSDRPLSTVLDRVA